MTAKVLGSSNVLPTYFWFSQALLVLGSHLISIQEALPLFQTLLVGEHLRGTRAFLRRPGTHCLSHLPGLWQGLS